jgi:hypothetical protein
VHLGKKDFILSGHVDVIFGEVSGFYQEFMFVFDLKRLGLSQFLLHCALLGASRKNCEKRVFALLCLSVCPHGTNRFPLEKVLLNFIFGHFSQIFGENSNSIKI